MWKNYLKIAWRSLIKEKTFTFLNIFGLSVAFGVAILLSMYALFALSYDRFHENISQIYQVYQTHQSAKGPEFANAQPIPFAGTLKEEVPGIEKITRYSGVGVLVSHDGKEIQMKSAFVDPAFFSIFSFPVIEGNNHPLQDRSEIALTQTAAINLFGDDSAIGKSVNVFIDSKEVPFTVTSIVQDIPDQSSIGFDIALNFKNQADRVYANNIDRWDMANHEVYLQLANNMSASQFEKNTSHFTELHYADVIRDYKRDGIQPDKHGQYIQQRLLPFKDFHFAEENNGKATANRIYPYLILGIAFLILFIASVNFINMNIAKSSTRLKEIGMRKTLGADKIQLFFQFWGESILIFVGALVIGALLAKFLLGSFQTLFNTKASFENVFSPTIILSSILLTLLITLIAGGYPAILMSKLGTLKALKGKIDMNGGNFIRNGLIITQFSIAILLISGTIVLWNQLEFMRNKNLGFNKEQVIAFPLNSKKDGKALVRSLRIELRDQPDIVNISASSNILGLGKDYSTSTSRMGFDHNGRGVQTNLLLVDYDYPETIGLEFIKGRSFDRSYAIDSLSIIVNEAMAKELGDEDILNTSILLEDSIHYSVIGVVKNYNFQSLDKKIEPLSIFLNPDMHMRYAYVKVTPYNLSNSYKEVKEAWNKIEPEAEFMGSFLDENIDRSLARERNMTTMVTSGSIIAIILSCVGLFAISLLAVSQRRKEIGIRKVVGASVGRITIMLTSDFLKLVLVAFFIASPISWFISSKYLEQYPYRIDLSLWIFILAGTIAIAIAIVTISFKTVRAAIQNPVKSLRSE